LLDTCKTTREEANFRFTVRGPTPVAPRLLPLASSLTTDCSLFTVHCSLFTAHRSQAFAPRRRKCDIFTGTVKVPPSPADKIVIGEPDFYKKRGGYV